MGRRKRREEEGELRGFQSRNRFPLLTSDFPQVLKPSASDGCRNEEASPSPGTCCPQFRGGDMCFPQGAKVQALGKPTAGTGGAGSCLTPARPCRLGAGVVFSQPCLLMRETGAKIPVEHSQSELRHVDLASNPNSPIWGQVALGKPLNLCNRTVNSSCLSCKD